MKNKWQKLFYHIIWLFLLGAFAGFIFESLWHLIKNGVLINKQGLWYGPFKPIYGTGLIIITALLYRIKDKNPIWLFIAGIIIGSTFEFIASIFQEKVFSTYTWSYKSFNYNLDGRIYLPYCIVWGAISYLWMHYGFNYYLKIFNKYYNKEFRVLSLIIFILMSYNISLTWIITDRYSDRKRDIAATTTLEKYIDKKYSSDQIEKKFPKLRVKY